MEKFLSSAQNDCVDGAINLQCDREKNSPRMLYVRVCTLIKYDTGH